MANTLYDKAREKFLIGSFNWSTDTIKVALVDSAYYTPNFSIHEFFSDITAVNALAVVAAGVVLVNKTYAGGAADADDVTFTTVAGAQSEYLVLYKDVGGVAASSPLIAVIDSATGLPITPNGGDIIIVWDNGTNRIFKL
jgi:hypothetical protein